MVLLRKYEIMILLTEEFNDNEVKAWVFNLAKMLRQFSVSDISVISLGKLKLSYPIDNKMKGTYLQLNFSGIPKFINNIGKILKMDSHIIRFLVVNKQK
jgi:ribosomal protein S6